MRGKWIFLESIVAVALLVLVVSLSRAQGPGPLADVNAQSALGTAFTYQGQLKKGGSPISGTCDFQFSLWDSSDQLTGQIGSTLTRTVSVSNGLFTVPLDFGAGAFQGDARWLQIAVKCAGDSDYTTLSPRQPLTAAPYALALPGLWTQPNATSPNLIGGYSGNSVNAGVVGATIGGGGASGAVNRVTDSYGVVGGGTGNRAGNDDGSAYNAESATVGGGYSNTAGSFYATVGGGWENTAVGYAATVGGGRQNSAADNDTTVGGGASNVALGQAATVAGGNINTANGYVATVSGGGNNTAQSDGATVGGGMNNVANGGNAVVSGGAYNTASGPVAAIGGGEGNTTVISYTVIGGGYSNLITDTASYATIAGGYNITVTGPYAAVGGGKDNVVEGAGATVGGGVSNAASAARATVGGGYGNTASGLYATVPGGYLNIAAGQYSFAAGRQARANNPGCFVWGDSTDADIGCGATDQFIVRANGGIWFGAATVNINPTIGPGVFISTSTGAYLSTGGTWTNASDRNTKENFEPVDPQAILEGVAQLPVTAWNYRAEDSSVRHIGPTAQDFHAAFGLGADDTHISTVDADGVALAAIQGLYGLVKEKEARIAELEGRVAALEEQNAAQQAQIDALETRLAALERQVGGTATPKNALPVPGLALGGLALAGAVVYRRRKRGGGR